jgi:hypothetical protein
MKTAIMVVGMILIVLGIVGLFAGGLIFPGDRTERGLGPLRVQHQETRSLPVPPLLSTLILLSGVALIAVNAKKT